MFSTKLLSSTTATDSRMRSVNLRRHLCPGSHSRRLVVNSSARSFRDAILKKAAGSPSNVWSLPGPCLPRQFSASMSARNERPGVLLKAAEVNEMPPAPEEASGAKRSSGGRDSRDGSPPEETIVPAAVFERNAGLVDQIRGKMILAPLTRGGSLPFRRLCVDFGADVTMSEMAFARNVLKGDRVERSRMYRASNEQCFGIQIATKTIDEGSRAAVMAAEAGASFVDLNCGCPIHEVTRRGLGAVLPQRPAKLARLVKGIASQSPIPMTVKIRIGKDDKSINAQEVVEALQDTGAAAVTIHGRTMRQRYRKAADWEMIGAVADTGRLPIIGNGDILTHYEGRRRLDQHNCVAVMAGRGALIKPWLFQEFKQGYELKPTAEERVGIYRQLVSHMKEHFGDDARGKKKAWYFLPWHFSFLCRYRPFPEEIYGPKTLECPLIGTRQDIADPERGESIEDMPFLERLLRNVDEELHDKIAHCLWDSASDTEAVAALEKLAADELEMYEAKVANRDDRDGQDRGDTQG